MIVALAGRRIDAADAARPRFPAASLAVVESRIDAALRAAGVSALVCAAACGADLIALGVARRRGIAAWIVLPFAAAAFRRTSVVDRGDRWGAAFDAAVAAAQAQGRLQLLGLAADDDQAYFATNAAIVERALALGGGDPAETLAIAVWDGPLDERTDYTADFVAAARRRDVPVRSIPILSRG